MENLEYLGHWWIPSDKNNKLCGILKFSENNGFTLKLLGKLDSDVYEVIVGTADDKKITLFSCLRKTQNRHINNQIIYQEYIVNCIFIGSIFTQGLKALKFNKFRVNYSFLSDWAKLPQQNQDGNWHYHDIISINWKTYTITLGQDVLLNNINSISKSNLFIKTNSPKTFFEVEKDIIIPIRNFLDIVTNQSNYITKFNIILPDDIKVTVMGKENLLNIADKYKNDQIFSLKDYINKFQTIIQLWLTLSEKIGWLIDLYCYIEYHNFNLPTTAKFIFIWQCLEGFYKNIVNNKTTTENTIKYFLEKDDSFILENLLSVADKEDKITYRLKQYHKKLKEKIVVTRDFYTHHFEDENKQILQDEQIFRVNYLLSFLFLHSLLKELQLEKEEIKFMINNQSTWLYLQKIFCHLDLLK